MGTSSSQYQHVWAPRLLRGLPGFSKSVDGTHNIYIDIHVYIVRSMYWVCGIHPNWGPTV